MHEQNESRPLDDSHRLDRLVDGELGDEERRQLLLSLEGEPDGWRRCALAFLESQSWGRELRALTATSDRAPAVRLLAPADAAPLRPVGLAPRRALGRLKIAGGTMLAMAASFLLAFTLGVVFRGGPEAGDPTTRDVAMSTAAPSDRAPSSIAAGSAVAGGASAIASTGQPAPSALAASAVPPTVRVSMNGEGGAETELPVMGPEQLGEAWLKSPPLNVPASVSRQLGRTGHRLQHQRQLVPVQLGDGRQAEVPVDRLQIQYVGDRYQ